MMGPVDQAALRVVDERAVDDELVTFLYGYLRRYIGIVSDQYGRSIG